ncbi:MAG: site-specific integrase [Candidatus Aminicenantes bacterium]|nr:site-specific integrase [Candidatus Aminicenantes bacterium]
MKDNSKRWSYGFGTVYVRKTKKGKIRYYLDYLDKNGKRKREVVLHAQTRAEAVLALQRKVSEILDTSLSPKRIRKILFREFSRLYLENYAKPTKKSWECDSYCIYAQLIPYFGENELEQITPFSIEKYRSQRLEDGVKKSTTNRELALLKKMFNLAIDWGYCQDNPVRKVKFFSEKDNLKEQILPEEMEQLLLEKSAEHLKPIIIIALHTGMRKNEILTLKWNHVDLKNRIIQVVETKNGENRTIPINEDLKLILHEQKLNGVSDYVFPNPETGQPFRSVRRSFENACRRAGISMRFHDLRHTFACRMIQRGCDIETLRALLGHHSVTITERYIHTNEAQKRNAVGLLSSGKPPQMAEIKGNLSHICHTGEKEAQGENISCLFSMN